MVYISEFDFLGGGKTIYHTDIADLMSCFTRKRVNNPKFPMFSAEVENLKQDEGGVTAMCKVMQHYEDIARKEERELIAKEMKRKDATIANQLAELAALRAQLAALQNGGVAPHNG